jgi:hypothetical protein
MTGGSLDLGRWRALVHARKKIRESHVFVLQKTWQRIFSINWNIKELNNYLDSYTCDMSTITGRAIPRLGFHPHHALTMCKSWL